MKASFAISSFIAGSLLASAAHAQLASEVPFGQSFELDDYFTEQRELAQQAPGLQWNNNPNIPAPTKYPTHTCYMVPGRLNVVKGEAILSTKPDSVIYQLLSSIGQQHSHSGMARDAYRIRHNTMFEGAVDRVISLSPPPHLKTIGDHSLRDGYPGTATHSVESALSYNEFNFANGVVLSGGSGVLPAFRVTELAAADAEMADFRGYYRLFAYTNMSWDDPYSRSYDDGNMCSGSMFFAHMNAGNRGWTWDQRRTYPADVRDPAAAVLYANVRHSVVEELDGDARGTLLDLSDLVGLGIVETVGRGETAAAIANQIVNCMAYDDCSTFTARWKQGVGAGKSLSPDDLLLLTYVQLRNAAIAGKTNTFAYTTSKPLEKTGDYVCCQRTVTEGQGPIGGLGAPQPGTPYTYTQCLRNY